MGIKLGIVRAKTILRRFVTFFENDKSVFCNGIEGGISALTGVVKSDETRRRRRKRDGGISYG